MGTNLEISFQQMLTASYGENWQSALSDVQISSMREAFFAGAQVVLGSMPSGVMEAAHLQIQCDEFLEQFRKEHGLS